MVVKRFIESKKRNDVPVDCVCAGSGCRYCWNKKFVNVQPVCFVPVDCANCGGSGCGRC